ncbi:CUB and sushi domain-containing protein 3-like [Hyperolius riggenbachi]|uniref:CUB and sushi domain-containing protein 3-like n=1 Tax=Hyperolius riggenbachi TaxID=752182 RepID=UPI0035A31E0C
MSDSRWSPSEEFCTLKRCPHPGDIDNGYFEAESFFFGSRVTYFCNEGYKMQSKRNYRDCLADGTWSNTRPVCEVTICPPPPTIPDGSFSPWKSEYQYRDSVTYMCNDRNAVMEHDSLFCTENGNWSNTEPRCTVVDCPSPNVPNSKKLSGFSGPYRLNFVVEFECNKGFTMNGSNTIRCTIQSTWDPPPPQCIVTQCPNPGDIENGYFEAESFFVGSRVTYFCNEGYRMQSKWNYRDCLADGTWSNTRPVCEVTQCPNPGDIENGYFEAESFFVGSRVTYFCNEGYRMQSNRNYRDCLADGTWSNTRPVCEVTQCLNPGDIENGYFEAESFFVGSRVTYFCNAGYRMQSKRNYRDCLADGTWSNTRPVCEVTICPPPPTIPDGSFSPWKSEYQYRDSVTYKCNDRNAVMEQHDSLFCTENGNWSNTKPRCTVVDCPSPNVPNSKKLSGFYGPYRLNYVVEFECDKGFKMSGSKTIQCTIQSTWDPPPPQCISSDAMSSVGGGGVRKHMYPWANA